jgi:hypothetical protein
MNKNRPTIVHPTIPGAVGSINSPYLDGRDKEQEAKLIIDDIVEILQGNGKPGNDETKIKAHGRKTHCSK